MGSTALVLSGGGMFGSYQAGVWKELSQFFDPDIVVGASVGSLNGWMVACGFEPSELVEHWRNLGELSHIRWQRPRSPWDGVVNSSAFEQWLRTTCESKVPQRRLGVVLTRVRNIRPTLFESPAITWEHLAASCAVPLFLRHPRIDGHYYSDGGLVEPLPLWAAVEMGATRIVTVNVMKHRPWMLRGGIRFMQACAGFRAPECSKLKIIDISPARPLGSARASMYWDRDIAVRWIEQGRRDALLAERQVIESLTCPRTSSIA